MGPPCTALFDLQTLSAYLTFLTELGVLLGGERNVTERSMLQVIELEQRIAQVRVPGLPVSSSSL